ncbi:MAG: hypothetical protein ABJF10_22140 [Chthoniobacter sp.]|uniref:hypothetical protein n=1 Tax=Chthoniobacter sp. TaxID=2510640 RepID=UPI0032AE7EEB
MKRLIPALAALVVSMVGAHAQPEGVISVLKSEGVMITSLEQPQFFIFQSGSKEEHFDGTVEAITAQGGPETGEPITDLHYLQPRLVVNGSPWSEEDRKLLEAQFHGATTAEFYLFKTVEGQLFYLPKEGQTPVVRVDYVLKDRRKVTVWMRK